jgi:hypothetical protein
MIGRRHLALALLTGATLILGGCSQLGLSDEEKAFQSATNDKAMWYRFTFEAEYGGKPFKIDQMVNCTRSVQSGGSLGQSPDTHIHEGYPRTAAAKMADGSQVLVRIPNMCRRYRAYELKLGYAGVSILAGWQSRGPHPIVPMVVWSDSTTKPTRLESYVARAYYAHPKARIKNPKGSLDLWPVGKYPDNAKEILNTPEAQPYYPHPWVNLDRDPDGRGKGRDGKYHGKFATYFTIPIDDPIEGFKKHAASANARISQNTQLRAPELKYQVREDENFIFYEGQSSGDRLHNYASDPTYIPASCVSLAFSRLITGAPGMSDFPYDPEDWASTWPLDVRTPGTEFHTPGNIALLNSREQRTRNCYARLGQLRSLSVVNGHLDDSGALPGAMVYIPLVERKDWIKQGLLISPEASGEDKKYNFDARFRIDGFPGKAIGGWSPEYVIKNKKTGKWYYYNATRGIYGGGGESTHF